MVLHAPIGSTVHDSATVSGTAAGGVPTGTVDFTVYATNSCDGQGSPAGTDVPLVAGVAHPSSTAVVGSGGLAFKAHYDGSATYDTSDGPCEPLSADKLGSSTATDIHNAAHAVVLHAPIGSTVHDSATVSGTAAGGVPTGTVDFTVYATNSCDGQGSPAGTDVPLVAGVAHPSSTAVVGSAGLAFKAHYDGSATYDTSDGPCEPLSADKLGSSTATDIHNAAHAVVLHAPIGSTVHDSATVSGTAAGGVPTGTVDFTVYATNSCDGQGSPAGTDVPLVAGVAHPSSTAVVGSGGLAFKAHYDGSATYDTSDGPCEPLSADKLGSSTATDIHNAAHAVVLHAPIGSTVHDSATVSGTAAGGVPTGTVDFTVYATNSCDGQGSPAGTDVPLVAGVAHPSSTAVVGSAGLAFKAHYDGSATYDTSDGPCEPLSADKLGSSTATDIHNAAHAVVLHAPIGSTVHDSATVSGTVAGGVPTGTVDFTVYATNSCDGQGSPAGTDVPLVAGVAHPSSTAVVGSAGLAFKAHYDGSATYDTSDGPCEPLSADKLGSSTATDIHNAAHAVVLHAPIGSTVHDSATVSGTAAGGVPTGTVDFTVYATNSCDGQGSPAGTDVPLVAGVAHPSSTAVVGSAGLAFKAHYDGSATYDTSDGPCEPLSADKLGSSTATDIHNAAHAVVLHAPIGSTVHDSATVSGTAAGGVPTGTVDFTVYATNSCDGQGSPAGTDVPLVAGVAHPSSTAVVGSAGLAFKAHYDGSATYDTSDGPCEPLSADKLGSSTATDIHNAAHAVVLHAPIGSTVHDSATVSGTAAGGVPTGTVDFTVYATNSCDGQGSPAGTDVPLVAGVAHPSSTAVVGSAGLAFKAHYDGSATYGTSDGPCEPLSADKLGSSTATDIHNAAHAVVLHAPIGSTVHDSATVSGTAAGGVPTGTVDFTVYATNSCDGQGSPAGTDVPLVAGVAHPSSTAVVGSGGLAFKAHYDGSATYDTSDGPCEPLSADKGTIQIVKDFTGLATGNKPVDLRLGTDVKKAGLTADGETDVMVVPPDTYLVNEVFTTPGDGDLYGSSFSCTNHGESIGQGGLAGPGRSVSVPLANGDAIVCTFTNERKDSAIEVDKRVKATDSGADFADSATRPEKGGQFTFEVTVTNPLSNVDDMTITSVIDSVYGDITKGGEDNSEIDSTDCDALLGKVLQPGDSASCQFTATFTGNTGASETDTVTVKANDESGRERTDTDTATVSLTDVPSKLTVVKTADPTTVQEGARSIGFTITITNVAQFTVDGSVVNAVDDITVFSLQDDKLGDLDAAGDVTCMVGGVTKAWPMTITPGQSIVCTVTRSVTGTPSSPHVNTATATGFDDDHPNGCDESQVEPFCKTASDDATVTFTTRRRPPHVPTSDVSVTKAATPAVQLPLGGGTAPITYNLVGQEQWPRRGGQREGVGCGTRDVSFVSATTSAGSCTTTAQALDCTITSLAPGASIAITINATVNATGTKTNVVIATTTTPETSPTNNTASASTVVTAPVTPPKPKPSRPRSVRSLTVLPKTLKATGKSQKIIVKVTKGEKAVGGAKVKITGAGITKTVKTGKNGKVVVTIKPSKPGIIKLAIQGAKTCNTQRIGVVGVFEPPVTG